MRVRFVIVLLMTAGLLLLISILLLRHAMLDALLFLALVMTSTASILHQRERQRVIHDRISTSERRYRTLARHLPNMGVILFDEHLVTRAVEGNVFTAAGYEPTQIENQPLQATLPAATHAILMPLYQDALGGVSRQVEYTALNGRTYSVHTMPLQDVNGRPGGMAVIHDITDRRILETQFIHAQKMEGIGRLAGGIAHDFNNLLTAILGIGELLLSEMTPNTQSARDVQEILVVAQRAAALTRQLLSFARQQIIQPRQVQISSLVMDTASLLRRVINEAIELSIIPAADLPLVIVDPAQIEQVLINLAVNARDAMPRGGTLTIMTSLLHLPSAPAPDLAPGAWVAVTIRDTGTGMSAHVLARVFEPFFTTKDPGKGTGLGLATSYGIIQQHGGTIRINSTLGVGTTVEILLPIAERSPLPDRTDDVPIMPPVRQASLTPGSGTIILVEDDSAVRLFAGRALIAAGYTVEMAEHGLAAWSLIQGIREGGGQIDLVISDVIMPLLSGPQLATMLHDRAPEIPVLLMSGYVDNTITHAGVVDSGIHFLQKPFTPASLTARVATILAVRRKGHDAPTAR